MCEWIIPGRRTTGRHCPTKNQEEDPVIEKRASYSTFPGLAFISLRPGDKRTLRRLPRNLVSVSRSACYAVDT